MIASLSVGALCALIWLIVLTLRRRGYQQMPALDYWLQRQSRSRGDNGDPHDPLLS